MRLEHDLPCGYDLLRARLRQALSHSGKWRAVPQLLDQMQAWRDARSTQSTLGLASVQLQQQAISEWASGPR